MGCAAGRALAAGEAKGGAREVQCEYCVRCLQVLYRAAKARFDDDEEFKTRSREAVTELQSGRPEYRAVRARWARWGGKSCC